MIGYMSIYIDDGGYGNIVCQVTMKSFQCDDDEDISNDSDDASDDDDNDDDFVGIQLSLYNLN